MNKSDTITQSQLINIDACADRRLTVNYSGSTNGAVAGYGGAT